MTKERAKERVACPFRLAPELKKRLDAMRKAHRRSLNEELNTVVEEAVAEWEKRGR